MKNLRLPAIIMAALVIGFLLLLGASVRSLPENVASHFDASGHPDGWTDRSTFVLLMGGVGLFLPVLFALLFLVIRFAPSLEAPRSEKSIAGVPGITFAYLLQRSFWFGSMTLCFIAAVQALIIEANSATPPRLNIETLLIVLAGFAVGVIFWSFSLLYHLSRARRTARPA
jgi:uncharacterized membrane protein